MAINTEHNNNKSKPVARRTWTTPVQGGLDGAQHHERVRVVLRLVATGVVHLHDLDRPPRSRADRSPTPSVWVALLV